jgi:hypothetical protein
MRSTFVSLTCGLALLTTLERGADAGTILVFGDSAARAEAADRLVEAGHEVWVGGALPQDLSTYDAVWHVGVATQFDDSMRNRLGDFMKTGRGVFLTGEWSCCETMNASVQQVVNRFVRSAASAPSSIAIGGLGTSAPGDQFFNPIAVGGVTIAPHELVEWRPGTTGRISGIDEENTLSVDVDGHPTGAVWSANELLPGGQLVILMDSDWYNRPGAGQIAANIATFLIEGAPENPWTKPEIDRETGNAMAPSHTITAVPNVVDEGDDADLEIGGCSASGGASGGLGLLGILGALAFVNRKKR